MQGIGFISLGLLVLLLIPVVLTDLAEKRIPNACNLALAAAGVALALIRSPRAQTLGTLGIDLLQTLALFLCIAGIIRLLKRSSGLGMGDIKFLAAASLWVGFGGATVLFILASAFAVIAAIVVAPWSGLDLKTPRPFGPMLAAALLTIAALSGLPHSA